MSLRAKVEKIFSTGAGGALPPGIVELCDEHEAAVTTARSNPDLRPEAVARLVSNHEDTTLRALMKMRDDAIALTVRELDQEEGQIRSALKPRALPAVLAGADADKLKLERLDASERLLAGRLFIDLAESTDSPEQLEDIIDDATLHGDVRVTRVVLAIARRKLEAQAKNAPKHQRHTGSPLNTAAAMMAQREARFLAANPSPSRRLKQLEASRRQRATGITSTFDFVTKLIFGADHSAAVAHRKVVADLKTQQGADAS